LPNFRSAYDARFDPRRWRFMLAVRDHRTSKEIQLIVTASSTA
jgi:hypothetical protein